jgi:acyl carrier protein
MVPSSREQIRQEVIGIVADIAEVPVAQITPDSTLEELGVDSLNGLRIVAAMEKRYDISIPDEAIGKIRSIPDIIALVDAHIPEG